METDILGSSMRALSRSLLLPVLLSGCNSLEPRAPAVADRGAGPGEASPAPASPRPELAWRVVGESVQGRPLRAATVGSGPRRVLWIGGIHGNEREGSVATAELPQALLAMPGAASAVTLTIIEDGNPDGSDLEVRGNANGVDLNRNFPAGNFVPHRPFGVEPLSQPEARAVHDLLLAVQPHLVLVAHSWSDDQFINFDGPARALGERFEALSGFPLRESGELAPTPGSLGAWVGGTLGIPILTLEYRRGRNPWDAWLETRTAILAVVRGG